MVPTFRANVNLQWNKVYVYVCKVCVVYIVYTTYIGMKNTTYSW